MTIYRELNFAIKVDPLNLESQNQTKNIPVVLPRFPNQNLRQIGPAIGDIYIYECLVYYIYDVFIHIINFIKFI